MNELIERQKKKLHEISREIMVNRCAMIEPLWIDSKYIEKALKEVYQKGIDDAIEIVENEEEAEGEPPKEMQEIFNQISKMELVRATIRATKKSIKNQLQQLKENQNGKEND